MLLHSFEHLEAMYWDDVIERIGILSTEEMLSLQAQLSLFRHVDALMLS